MHLLIPRWKSASEIFAWDRSWFPRRPLSSSIRELPAKREHRNSNLLTPANRRHTPPSSRPGTIAGGTFFSRRIKGPLRGRCPGVGGGRRHPERPRHGIIPDLTAYGERSHLPGVNSIKHSFLRQFVIVIFCVKLGAVSPLSKLVNATDALRRSLPARDRGRGYRS